MNPSDDDNPWPIWRDAAGRDAVDAAIRALYADLDAAVRAYGPTCWASGKCCRFDSYGHRLYVTGLEIAWFLMGVGGRGPGSVGERSQAQAQPSHAESRVPLNLLAPSPEPCTPDPIRDACRYQIDGLCSVHADRPLGCRIFFCQQGTDDWQQATYESFMQRLKKLHAEHGLPYQYMEWRAGLVEADRSLSHSDTSI